MRESIPIILSYSYYYIITIQKEMQVKANQLSRNSEPSTDSGHIVPHHFQVANAASLSAYLDIEEDGRT